LREIRISAGLDHPGIAGLRAAQRSGNQLLMIMEYVEGSTLADLMHNGHIGLKMTLSYISQALAALDYAHARGVIHRDLKPSNIMVTPSGQLKLMDFGVAKLASDAKLTKTGLLVGSLHYMSPEQIEGKDLDGRSDIYSLGVTLYEMITGVKPFNGDSEYQIMAAHLEGHPPAPRQLDNSVPAEVNDLILTAIARDPQARFGSAKAMKAAVDGILARGTPIAVSTVLTTPQAPLPHPGFQPVQAKKNHRTAYMLAGSLATLAVLIAGAIELPKFYHPSAHNSQSPAEAVPQKMAAPKPPESTPAAAQTPLPSETQHTNSEQEGESVGQQQSRVPESLHSPHVRSRSRGSIEKFESTEQRAPKSIPADRPAPIGPVPLPLQPQSPLPALPSIDTAALDQVRDTKSQLDARITAIRSSLDNLRRQQADQGLTLRGDITAAEQRVFDLMNEANRCIAAGDAANAAKRLEAADVQLTKIEQFLGR
jgi:serine/threonine-protein kinase